jgi:transcription elongation factor GreA
MPKRQRYLTREGQQQLRGELEDLKTVKRPDVAARIHQATAAGGTADNAEYEQVKNEQAFVEGKILDLEEVLSNAVVPSKKKDAAGTVQFGSSVTVVNKARKKTVYKLVGSAEAKPLEGKISNESPVGQALLNHKVGDVVEVSAPAGITELRITKVS